MANIRLRITRHWPFPGKDILAALVFSKNAANRRRFPVFQGIVGLPWGLMWCDTRSAIEWQLYVKNEYEPVIGRLIQALLKPGDCFVDVGANIGVHSLLAVACVGAAGKVIAVEPNPEIFERLRRNCELNRARNVVLRQCALGDRAGRRELAIFPDRFNQGLSTFVTSAEDSQQIEVDLVTGDELVASSIDQPIALIKIDTEGWEVPVLHGFRHTLQSQQPVVIFEHRARLWQAAGFTLQQVSKLLAGYRLYEVAYAGLKPIAQPGSFERSADLVALPARLAGPPELKG